MIAKTKTIIALVVTAAFALLYIFGWSDIGIELSENTIWMSVIDVGYGTDNIKAVAEEYRKINPNVQFYWETKANLDEIVESSLTDPNNERDLYYSSVAGFQKYASGAITGKNGEILIEDLTGLFNSTAYGESRTIREKYRPEFLPLTEYEGKNWIMHWANGPCGLIYNKTMFEENGWELPRTTDDLIRLAETIRNANLKAPGNKTVYPFAWAGQNASNYWQYVSNVWWAQYQGENGFTDQQGVYQGTHDDFWQFTYNGSVAEGYKVYEQTGRLEGMKVLEELLRYDRRAMNYDSNALTWEHIAAQQEFLLGRAAMIPSGDWMENEMRKLDLEHDIEIGVMPTPIISALQDRLGLSDEQWERALETDGVNAEVDYAKSLVYNVGANMVMMIPSGSKQKELTKDFLRFLYSDRGMEIFLKNGGSGLAATFTNDIDTSDLTEFEQEKLAINDYCRYVFTSRTHPLGYIKQLRGFEKNWPMETKLAARQPSMKKTAQQIYEEEIQYAKEEWSEWLAYCGL